MRISAAIIVTLGVVACASQRVETSAASRPLCDSTRVPVQPTTWHEVSADGFTYCVPSTWRAIGGQARHWHGPDVDFAWADRDPHTKRAGFVVVQRRDGAMRDPDPDARAAATRVTFTEQIDGRTVRLALEHSAGLPLRSSNNRLEPALTLFASAQTAGAVEEVLAAYRSVRFVRKP